ncbi:MAG: D-alanyl-D-alanine carboxypeptidase [Actinomycetota bacterium]|nr:D-alanyl-D-alanine carboxypeptidase [Rubrobacter sp.]MDQ3509774.1 D-alanyl-D-alanine carboxypeptidase [Actinomycetota bacterium]
MRKKKILAERFTNESASPKPRMSVFQLLAGLRPSAFSTERCAAILAKTAIVAAALFILLAPMNIATDQAESQETTEQTAPETEAPEADVPDLPDVDAEAWAVVDEESGLFLAGENADERLPIASITKIMVALVALENDANLDEEVVVSEQAERFVGFTYSNVGLIQGESVSRRDLLTASLVPSGTEAVYALAESLGEGEGEAGVEDFVGQMNEKADEMGLENTNFADPAGLDDPENYSSARDLGTITAEAMEYEPFVETVAETEATISTDTREIDIVTTNQILTAYSEATGVKTGTSPEAGPSLVASADGEGNESYIAVILGAASEQNRFTDAEALLRDAFERYERSQLIREGEPYEERMLPSRRDESVELAAAETISATVSDASEVERRVTAGELPASAGEGDELGEVELIVEGESVGTSPLVAGSGYEEASIIDRAWFWVSGFFQ